MVFIGMKPAPARLPSVRAIATMTKTTSATPSKRAELQLWLGQAGADARGVGPIRAQSDGSLLFPLPTSRVTLMEIASFFRLSWRRVIPVVVATLVAAAAAGAFVARQPVVYQARTVMLPAQMFAPGIADYQIPPLASQFVATVDAPAVVNEAAKASGQSAGAIAGGIKTATVGDGPNVAVTYSSTDAKAAQTVVRVVAHTTLSQLALHNLNTAREYLAQSQRAATDANTKVATFQSEHGVPSAAPANGGADLNNSLRTQYNALLHEVDRTTKAIDDAGGRISDAQLQVQVAAGTSAVSARGAGATSNKTKALRAAVSAGVVVAMLGIVLLLLQDLRRQRKRGKSTASRPPDATTAPTRQPAVRQPAAATQPRPAKPPRRRSARSA
jgi:hypothetical protein